jgi:hypothetical protein
MAKGSRNYDPVSPVNAPFKSRFGGFARACKYEPVILSEWAAKGGQAVLQKYGREHFVEMRKRRKNYSRQHTEPEAFELDPSVMKKLRQRAARENGRKGGELRAERYFPKCRQAMAREGGIATRNRYGNDFFRGDQEKAQELSKGLYDKKDQKATDGRHQ